MANRIDRVDKEKASRIYLEVYTPSEGPKTVWMHIDRLGQRVNYLIEYSKNEKFSFGDISPFVNLKSEMFTRKDSVEYFDVFDPREVVSHRDQFKVRLGLINSELFPVVTRLIAQKNLKQDMVFGGKTGWQILSLDIPRMNNTIDYRKLQVASDPVGSYKNTADIIAEKYLSKFDNELDKKLFPLVVNKTLWLSGRLDATAAKHLRVPAYSEIEHMENWLGTE